uniref:Uncharacterized protein n=1 Tax=Oryza rufipogon TaxID=4529 RepID=A0A1V1H1B9_ORYRU|nr:hypothetical protein [Oryza rufipogon]
MRSDFMEAATSGDVGKMSNLRRLSLLAGSDACLRAKEEGRIRDESWPARLWAERGPPRRRDDRLLLSGVVDPSRPGPDPLLCAAPDLIRDGRAATQATARRSSPRRAGTRVVEAILAGRR